MKKILALVLVSALAFVSCEGDQGPPGEDGLDGLQGQVFEIEGVDFVYESEFNLYSAPFALEEYTNFDILEQDGLLIYRYGDLRDVEGNIVNGWELLPLTAYDGEGRSFQYGFSHAQLDAEIRITSEFDISDLEAGYTQDQIFRFIILPNDWAPEAGLNKNNMEEVLNSLKIDKIERLNLKN
ncbi:hypothetical protein [Sinomicrobium sp. M5D2P17]